MNACACAPTRCSRCAHCLPPSAAPCPSWRASRRASTATARLLPCVQRVATPAACAWRPARKRRSPFPACPPRGTPPHLTAPAARRYPTIPAAHSKKKQAPPMDIGFIGLGRMGQAIAGNLLRAGHRLNIWNRSPAAAQALVAGGAHLVEAPAGAAAGEVLMSMLADDEAHRRVLIDGGVFAGG